MPMSHEIVQLLDIILIALQVVGPADGSSYYMDYYGPRMEHVEADDNTVFA